MTATVAPNFGPFDARFLSREQAERYRDRYKTGRRAKTHAREQAALRRLLKGVGPLSKVLDLPAGTGRFAALLAQHSENLILADSSPSMLDVARDDLAALGAAYLHTAAERIELPDGAVDLVFCHRLLPHIYDAALRQRMLGEFQRVTRKYVLLSFYPAGLRSRVRWWLHCRRGGADRRDQLSSLAQCVDEAAACGLRVTRSEPLRRFPAAAFLLFERA